MNDIIDKLKKFAQKYNIVFEQNGDVGFLRPATGFTKDDYYIDYNPMGARRKTFHKKNEFVPRTYEPIVGLQDNRWLEIKAKNAYCKHDCLCVTYDDGIDRKEALIQLCGWVDKIEEIGAKLVCYSTGYVDSGDRPVGWAFMLDV